MRIFIFFFFFFHSASAQEFNHRFHFDYPAAVLNNLVVTDSCYYATGIIADSVAPFNTGNVFVKFDLEGKIEFTKTLTSEQETYEVWFSPLIPLDDGFITAGYSIDSIIQSLVIRYNLVGDTLWTSRYKNLYYPEAILIVVKDFIELPDGSFLILTTQDSRNNETAVTIRLIKIDQDGSELWHKTIYDSASSDIANNVIVLPDNSLLVLGQISNLHLGLPSGFNIQTLLIKADSLANEQWTYKFIEDELVAGYDMVLSNDNTVVIGGAIGREIETPPDNELYWNGFVFKADFEGNILWRTEIRENVFWENTRFNRIIEAPDNSGYLLAGTFLDPTFGVGGYDNYGWLAKVSPDGDSLWSRSFSIVNSNITYHEFNYLSPTTDGGYLICGQASNLGLGTAGVPRQQGWLLKVDEYGCLVPGCHITTSAEVEPQEFRLKLYPNPTSDFLNIYVQSSPENKEGFLRIVDVQGRVIEEFKNNFTGITYVYPVYSLTDGMYFLQYWADNTLLQSSRFIVQR